MSNNRISIEQIFEELNDANIGVSYNSDPEGFYFHDMNVEGDRGDGLIYESREEAAYAAYFELNSDPADRYDGDGMTDAEAEADVLRNAGMGTDEDYGMFHDDSFDHLERDHDETYIPDSE